MKKLFTTLALCAGLSFGAFAQHCAQDSTAIHNPGSATPGLSPSDTALPCALIGVPVSDTIFFTNFTTFSSLTVNYLKIDSIYLPTGLCWVASHPNNQFAGGESGVLLVQGTTTAPAGQYKLRIIVDANAGPGGLVNLQNQNAETLAHLRYEVRVACFHDGVCPAFNSTDTVDNYIPYTSQNPCQVGINEVYNDISDVTVKPNPFTNATTLTFNSDVEGAYTVKMMSLIGTVVSTKPWNVTRGTNNIPVERNGLSAGVYLLSISNGSNSITKKVIVE